MQWYARGARLLGRTAVECTRDPLAGLIARDVAALADAARMRSRLAVDLFAGSANTLYWITQQARARRGVGFELDPAVFRLSAENLARLGLDLELRPQDYREGLAALPPTSPGAVPGDHQDLWGGERDPASNVGVPVEVPPSIADSPHWREVSGAA